MVTENEIAEKLRITEQKKVLRFSLLWSLAVELGFWFHEYNNDMLFIYVHEQKRTIPVKSLEEYD